MANNEKEIAARVKTLLAQMSVEEKAGQLTQYFTFPGVPEQLEKVENALRKGLAGSLLFVADAEEIDRLQHIAVNESRLGIPLLFGYDVIHGFKTAMPVPLALAASWDPELAEECQAVAAKEARSIGLHWTFAPMIDISRDQRWGRMIEGAGEDPFLASAMAAAQVRGFQGTHIGEENRLISGPKHLAGYGASLGGRDYDEVDLSDNELWNIYLPPFKAAIDAGAGNIMSAYMGVNGVPATGNKWLLSDVLRKEWGFEGFVVTDAGAASDLETHHFAADQHEAAVRALSAGVDMEMAPPFGKEACFANLPAALETGEITMEQLDNSVSRILEHKFKMGLFENPFVDVAISKEVLSTPAHREVARAAAEASPVLLRNEGQLLPLSKDVGSIAVIGPFADAARDSSGPWIFCQDDNETITVLKGLKNYLGEGCKISHSVGVSIPKREHPSIFENPFMPATPRVEVDDDQEIARAVKIAKETEVAVLVLGEAQIMIGENASRSSFDLPGRQQELLEAILATGTPTVLLIMTGRPVDLKGATPDSQMMIWYPGTRGGQAIADLLFGDTVPSGKLPYNWPRNIGQVPLPYSQLRSFKPEEAEMRYWNESNSPLYPFGFGLSYTDFTYEDLKPNREQIEVGSTVQVSVKVTNNGSRPAKEVVQLYIHQRAGTSARPMRELKGFSKCTLEPGETKNVTFDLGANKLKYWSAATRDWVQDKGMIEVHVGTNVRDTIQSQFEVV